METKHLIRVNEDTNTIFPGEPSQRSDYLLSKITENELHR